VNAQKAHHTDRITWGCGFRRLLGHATIDDLCPDGTWSPCFFGEIEGDKSRTGSFIYSGFTRHPLWRDSVSIHCSDANGSAHPGQPTGVMALKGSQEQKPSPFIAYAAVCQIRRPKQLAAIATKPSRTALGRGTGTASSGTLDTKRTLAANRPFQGSSVRESTSKIGRQM
jgi:hypothetical protein